MTMEEVYAHFRNGTDEKYNLEDSTYLISTNMDRSSLSKMINELLKLENPVSFDILMNDDRLRGTVSEKMEECKIESESTVELTYVLAVTEPSQTEVDNLNDWISGLCYDKHSDLSAVCTYKGRVAVYRSDSLKKVLDFSNNRPKSSVHLRTNRSDPSVTELVCGHLNGLIEVYSFNMEAEKPFNNLVATNEKFTDTVTSVTTDPEGRVIVSGGYDKLVNVYENVKGLELGEDKDLSKNKKRPHDEKKVLSQLGSLEYHTKAVTKVKFSTSKNSRVVSSSMDGYMCTWDLNKKGLESSHNTRKPVTCFGMGKEGNYVCTGSNDGSLSVWDLRTQNSGVELTNGNVPEVTYERLGTSRAFERLVSDISWNPEVNMVSAVGLDGKVLLVDIRSPKFPLQKTQCYFNNEPDRGTCTEWITPNDVVYATASGLLNKLNYREIGP